MATHLLNEEKQVVKLIERLPLGDRVKSKWVKSIEEGGLNEELAKEIHDKIIKSQKDKELTEADHTALVRYSMDFARLVGQWRLARQASHFAKH